MIKSKDTHHNLQTLRDLIKAFVSERDWDKFNTPKNLAAALCVEAGELLEPFQWLIDGSRDELGDKKLDHIKEEMGDVLIYLVYLADKLEVDLIAAALEKIKLNEKKYPAEKVRGDARKYTEYE